ncbi:MAG TPA: S8 family serine peptidase, partial [Longimicrobium sp.]
MLAVLLPSQSVEVGSAARNEAQTLKHFADEFGARIVEDFRFSMDLTRVFEASAILPANQAHASLDDVVRQIRATDCWEASRGEGVLVAVVDTGINGMRPEFPAWKRVGAWQESGDPWVDPHGHGTMCASIAAGTRAEGGRFDGVAPRAGLVACRTEFFDSQLTLIYDYLRDLSASTGKRIVATNSFGLATGSPPDPPDLMVTSALSDAIEAGIVVCFSAGNSQELT